LSRNRSLLRKGPEKLDGAQGEIIVIVASLVCLSQPDEREFPPFRDRKGGDPISSRKIRNVRFPINLGWGTGSFVVAVLETHLQLYTGVGDFGAADIVVVSISWQ
jgi:hypothetical protein